MVPKKCYDDLALIMIEEGVRRAAERLGRPGPIRAHDVMDAWADAEGGLSRIEVDSVLRALKSAAAQQGCAFSFDGRVGQVKRGAWEGWSSASLPNRGESEPEGPEGGDENA